jgi:hypothetical protein
MAFGAHLPAQTIFMLAAAPLLLGVIVALLIMPRYRAQLQRQRREAEAAAILVH